MREKNKKIKTTYGADTISNNNKKNTPTTFRHYSSMGEGEPNEKFLEKILCLRYPEKLIRDNSPFLKTVLSRGGAGIDRHNESGKNFTLRGGLLLKVNPPPLIPGTRSLKIRGEKIKINNKSFDFSPVLFSPRVSFFKPYQNTCRSRSRSMISNRKSTLRLTHSPWPPSNVVNKFSMCTPGLDRCRLELVMFTFWCGVGGSDCSGGILQYYKRLRLRLSSAEFEGWKRKEKIAAILFCFVFDSISKMSLRTVLLFVFLLNWCVTKGNDDTKRLYDDLINGYNSLIRPVGNNSDRLTVKMGLRLSQLIDVVSSNSPIFAWFSIIFYTNKKVYIYKIITRNCCKTIS